MYTLPHNSHIRHKCLEGAQYRGDFLQIISGEAILKREFNGVLFQWDGCSGARDGETDHNGLPITWRASSIHDAFYRFEMIPLTHNQKDKIFRDELIKCAFRWGWNKPIEVRIPYTKKVLFTIPANFFTFPPMMSAYMYYAGVRCFGWAARWNNKRKKKKAKKASLPK